MHSLLQTARNLARIELPSIISSHEHFFFPLWDLDKRRRCDPAWVSGTSSGKFSWNWEKPGIYIRICKTIFSECKFRLVTSLLAQTSLTVVGNCFWQNPAWTGFNNTRRTNGSISSCINCSIWSARLIMLQRNLLNWGVGDDLDWWVVRETHPTMLERLAKLGTPENVWFKYGKLTRPIERGGPRESTSTLSFDD